MQKEKMKKMVVIMNVHDDKSKEKVIRTVASCSGITTITVDSEDGKLTVIGDFEVMQVLSKLKRRWANATLATFGPYDEKKEAETAADMAKKKKEETEREKLEAKLKSCRENPSLHVTPIHHHTIVCDHDHGCVIS